jgi:BolA family transcriptional regulator, general stress-responsive regulator
MLDRNAQALQTQQQIEQRLRDVLQPLEIEVIDDSALHAGHAGAKSGGGHFRLRCISAQFDGLPRLKRHRLVYSALHDLMQRDIHALAMTLLAPAEAVATPK